MQAARLAGLERQYNKDLKDMLDEAARWGPQQQQLAMQSAWSAHFAVHNAGTCQLLIPASPLTACATPCAAVSFLSAQSHEQQQRPGAPFCVALLLLIRGGDFGAEDGSVCLR